MFQYMEIEEGKVTVRVVDTYKLSFDFDYIFCTSYLRCALILFFFSVNIYPDGYH